MLVFVGFFGWLVICLCWGVLWSGFFWLWLGFLWFLVVGFLFYFGFFFLLI